ncbi:unnamed protein product [Chilo suppressalis]|uniref:RdRp catalytic domain-containing protein n=1 Tax=Chilo suppressalis TaxID=168631 RepID=A0ABN8L8P0_CHISP|nr:unnamed protein product [Chilo suppressalis]
MGFYYLLIKKNTPKARFQIRNESFYTRIPWYETKVNMLNEHNQEWFTVIKDRIDDHGYIPASPGFRMGMLNAASTTVGLVTLAGIEIPNTIIRSLRSSDDFMTIFVASEISQLAVLIGLTYSAYRLFGINPSREKTILFPESYTNGEYNWYLDKDFVGQYQVETSSLKPQGENPQDDFNSIAFITLQLMQTHIINVIGAIVRLSVGIDNIRKLWNQIKKGGGKTVK